MFSLDYRVRCSDKESKTPPTAADMCDWQLFLLSREDTKIDSGFQSVMTQSHKATVQSMFACLQVADSMLWGNNTTLCIIESVYLSARSTKIHPVKFMQPLSHVLGK